MITAPVREETGEASVAPRRQLAKPQKSRGKTYCAVSQYLLRAQPRALARAA